MKSGNFYPPEGSTFFSEKGSLTIYNTGGGKHSSPRAWPLGARLYEITLEPDLKYDRDWFDVKAIKPVNLARGSSILDCMYASSSVTVTANESELKGFMFGGKYLTELVEFGAFLRGIIVT